MTLVPFIRVLHIVPRIESGGVENYLLDLTKHLKDYHIKSYLASAGGKLSDAFKKNDVYLIEGHFHLKNPLAQIINAFHLCKIIHQHHIDLVHVHSRAPAWATIVASKVMKVPSLSTFHGVYAHTNLFKRFYNSAMLCVDGVIAISQYVDNHVRQTYPDKTKNLHLIEEGIDINRFDPALISIDAIGNIKKQLGISDTTKVLSLIGRFSPIKGHEVAIQAFEKLVSQFDHSFHLLFVGDPASNPEYLKKLKKLIHQKDLDRSVSFIFGIDMPLIYAMSDVVLMLSTKPEAFGRVTAEAMAMQRRVVGVPLGATPEVMADFGYPVPSDDAKAVANAIVNGLSDNNLERLKNQRQHILNHYNLDHMTHKTYMLYKDMLKDKKI